MSKNEPIGPHETYFDLIVALNADGDHIFVEAREADPTLTAITDLDEDVATQCQVIERADMAVDSLVIFRAVAKSGEDAFTAAYAKLS